MPIIQHSTLADYLKYSLQQLGIKQLFATSFNHAAATTPGLEVLPPWYSCHEPQHAVYAADAYSKLHNYGAIISTTAEDMILALPALIAAKQGKIALLHLEIIDNPPAPAAVSSKQQLPFNLAYAATTTLTASQEAAGELQRILLTLTESQEPVLISIPAALLKQPLTRPMLRLPRERLASYSDHASKAKLRHLLHNCQRPLLIIDRPIQQQPQLLKELSQLIRHKQIPFVLSLDAKGMLSECNRYYYGICAKEVTNPALDLLQVHCDLIIEVWPQQTTILPLAELEASYHPPRLRLFWQEAYYGKQNLPNLWLGDVISQILIQHQFSANWALATTSSLLTAPLAAATYPSPIAAQLWQHLNQFLVAADILIGARELTLLISNLKLAKGLTLIQAPALALGYTLPAALGAGLAQPSRRLVLMTTPADFMACLSELISLSQAKLRTIIFIINLAPLPHSIDYQQLSLACGNNLLYYSVTNCAELALALSEIQTIRNSSCLVEIKLSC